MTMLRMLAFRPLEGPGDVAGVAEALGLAHELAHESGAVQDAVEPGAHGGSRRTEVAFQQVRVGGQMAQDHRAEGALVITEFSREPLLQLQQCPPDQRPINFPPNALWWRTQQAG